MRTCATPEQIARWVEAVKLRDAGLKVMDIGERFKVNPSIASRLVARGRKYLLVESMKRKGRKR